MDQLGMYITGMPEAQRRSEAGSATIAWLVQRAVGGNGAEYDNFFSGYAQLPDSDTYEYTVAMDIKKAVRLDIITQEMVNVLGMDAFKSAIRTEEA